MPGIFLDQPADPVRGAAAPARRARGPRAVVVEIDRLRQVPLRVHLVGMVIRDDARAGDALEPAVEVIFRDARAAIRPGLDGAATVQLIRIGRGEAVFIRGGQGAALGISCAGGAALQAARCGRADGGKAVRRLLVIGDDVCVNGCQAATG